MTISLKLLIINEILQLLDIGTTEYSIKKELAREGNPLVKTFKKRALISYPLKITVPFWFYIGGRVAPSLKTFTNIVAGIVALIQSGGIINNLYVIGSELKKKRKNDVERNTPR